MSEFFVDNLVLTLAVGAAIVVAVIIMILFYFYKKSKKKVYNGPSQDDFILALGGAQNIISASSNQSRLQVFVKDASKADGAKLKELGASGVVKTSKKVSIIVGKISVDIADKINKALKEKV